MARTIIYSILAFLIGVAVAVLVLVVGHANGYVAAFPDPAKQVELLAVYLAASTLALGAVAVGVALFGILGYAVIKAEAIAAATRAGREAGEKAIAPLLEREMRAAQLSVPPQEDDGTLDPLTEELSRKV